MEKKSINRFLELDGLRGIAVFAVIFFHYTTRYNELFGHVKQPYNINYKFGYLGVQLFFIISGFVIFLSVEKSKNILEFILKRIIRLFPAYWFSVFLTFTVVIIFPLPNRGVSLGTMLVNLTMLQGFFGIPSVDGAYWSLQVELAFYFLISIASFLRLLNITAQGYG